MKLIDKDALAAEINRRIKEIDEIGTYLSPKGVLTNLLCSLDSIEVKEVEEEPVSKDLEEAADNYVGHAPEIDEDLSCFIRRNAFITGAQWQRKQMEKNRIAHCDNITEEQYNLETGFLDGFLDKNKRMPTFLDAIEYGMKKVKKDERNT